MTTQNKIITAVILVALVGLGIYFFQNNPAKKITTIRLNPEELDQLASDACEGVYENEGVEAFNKCRAEFINANA